ncbi:Calx-beta domain-containing protein, partial [Paraconexibacter sp.]|uniref:Calx-beta domain-containing protein n=1 Tax=Paraconexibacter sp. TaxID=2949640 RepID=UPI0035696E84
MTRSVVSQLIAICTIGAAVAIGATPAVASTASVSGGVLTVANGNFGPEDNEFLVSCSGGPTGATCTVQDAGATLFPGPNCTLVTATCTGVDRVVVNAGAGSDVVEVAATLGTANQLNGGDGDDVLHSGTGDDVLMGGDGTDAVSYARRAGGVTASVAAAAGGATGTLESDTFGEIETLIGGSGNDVLRGGAGADTVDGGPGSDVINGGPGSDTLIGGAGTDTLSYDDRSAGVTVVLNGTSGATAGSEIDTTSAFENALGGSGNDLITGDATANQLDGAGGDDTLIGGPGDDTLIGGTGTDRVSYADRTGAADGVTVDLGAGTGGASAGGEADAITSVENLTGGAGPDVLTGSAAVNDVAGLGGNDTIAVSDAVADTVSCGAGTDAAGGDERDTLGTGTPNDCEARDQPARATFSVDDPTATEGDGGNPDLTFTVSLSRAVLYPVSVDYAIAPGTAQTPGDYTANDALTGTLTFTPGTTERTVRVAVTDDDLNEPSETLTLTLSNPVEATISGATGTGTIVDD